MMRMMWLREETHRDFLNDFRDSKLSFPLLRKEDVIDDEDFLMIVTVVSFWMELMPCCMLCRRWNTRHIEGINE